MKILVIIQRSNGDVFLTLPLIRGLVAKYPNCQIDMLVNDDTLAIAKTLPNINEFIVFSYAEKKAGFISRIAQEKRIFSKIWRQYDLSINLTSSDRSVQYAIMASSNCISAVENEKGKSWWKKLFLKQSYTPDRTSHIVENNCKPLKLLGIDLEKISVIPTLSMDVVAKVSAGLESSGINVNDFFIFHPSAQYDYKIYPKELRAELLRLLADADIQLIVTGGRTNLDVQISQELPVSKHIHNLIGKTSIEELFALVYLSRGYIGMDTLVMHIAAGFNKPIFAIFGPTLTTMWRPWKNEPDQLVRIFQAPMECVPCGKAGCDDKHGKSECLYNISSKLVAEEIIKFAK